MKKINSLRVGAGRLAHTHQIHMRFTKQEMDQIQKFVCDFTRPDPRRPNVRLGFTSRNEFFNLVFQNVIFLSKNSDAWDNFFRSSEVGL